MNRKRQTSKSRITGILIAILLLIYILLPSPSDKTDDPVIPGGNDISITDTDIKDTKDPSDTGKKDPADPAGEQNKDTIPDKDAYYYSLDDVVSYLKAYGELPDNYIRKSEAYDLGWDSDEGNLWEVADGMVIGGDNFGNREGLLPKGVKYYECDVNYYGGYRGDDRIVFSSDGNIYFTTDHYKTFEHMGTFEVE